MNFIPNIGKYLCKKEKKLTQEDIDLLFSENWLTIQQQIAFNIYEGVTKSDIELESLCPDQTVLNFIFKEKEIMVDNIQYNVHHYFYGKSTFSETFNDIKDAILLREKLIKSIHPDNIRIEVFYD